MVVVIFVPDFSLSLSLSISLSLSLSLSVLFLLLFLLLPSLFLSLLSVFLPLSPLILSKVFYATTHKLFRGGLLSYNHESGIA